MRQWACSLPLNRSPPRACECSYVYLSHISGGLTMAAVGLMIRWDPGVSTVGGMHSALSLRTLVSLVVCEWHESMPAPEGCWEGREGSYCRCEGECSTGAAALSMNRCGPLPDFWSNFWENKQASQQTKNKKQTSKISTFFHQSAGGWAFPASSLCSPKGGHRLPKALQGNGDRSDLLLTVRATAQEVCVR